MLDTAIRDFLQDRKMIWLKKKIKANITEEGKSRIEQEASDLFSLPFWLPDAAKRAGQLSMVSHPAKFSHPNAKTTTIIASSQRRADGYLRSGNITAALDVLGNAAALDVYKFLSLVLQDGKTILNHLEENTDYIQKQLHIPTMAFEVVAQGLLAIKSNKSDTPTTHGGVKQVYFPVEDDYHLFSVLMPSGILYEQKNRINDMRFSEKAKVSREARKKNELADSYSEIYGLTSIGFGGTKPQNISVVNSQNGGVAYLLPALPPVLEGRRLNPPRSDFFDPRYTSPDSYREHFQDFHKTLSLVINNQAIRRRIKGLVKAIFFAVIERSWELRYIEAGWSDSDRYTRLPRSQKLWLDQQYRDAPDKDAEWLETIQQMLIRWFIKSYETLLDKQAYKLADYEFIEFKNWLNECGEGLK